MANVPTICKRCQKRLGPQVIRANQTQYHPQCFICDSCKKPLEKSFMPRGERLYHPECHEKLFTPRCHHCGEAIQGPYSRDAVGRYHPDCYTQLHHLVCSLCQETIRGTYAYDHWGNKAHTEHSGVKTGICHVCARLMASDASGGGRALNDGRLICGGCHQTEVQDFRQIQQAKLDVIQVMQSVGFAYIPDYIKVELSDDQQLLNERMRASPTGNIHGFTRTSKRLIPGYGEILEHSISVLSGLPRIAFMGVLAHELLHVWIHEQGLSHLSHAEVEGFCNLGTALMLSQALKGPDAALAQVLLQRMEEDPDPAYGDGYRAMAWRRDQLGWSALIEALHNREQALAQPEPERIKAKPRSASFRPAQAAAAPAAPSAASKAASERLNALKSRLQNSPAMDANQPKQTEKAPRPAVSSEIADKVRERFARPTSPPLNQPKPGLNKPGSLGGSKLGKLKKKKD